MRVIAGKFKGRKLSFPKSHAVRPTSSMVKEAVFSKIFESVLGARFLDCFCGSGQMGIEALSRGAEFVWFIDNSPLSIKTVRHNLAFLNEPNAKVVKGNVLKVLEGIEQSFDIVFLDPPYDYQNYEQIFFVLKENNVLAKNGLVVCEHDKQKQLNFEGYKKMTTKNYGAKSVSYFSVIN